MAVEQSIQQLSFNFGPRTFAHRRLAQGLIRSFPAFSSFVCEYLNPVVKTGISSHYVNDIGMATHTEGEKMFGQEKN